MYSKEYNVQDEGGDRSIHTYSILGFTEGKGQTRSLLKESDLDWDGPGT